MSDLTPMQHAERTRRQATGIAAHRCKDAGEFHRLFAFGTTGRRQCAVHSDRATAGVTGARNRPKLARRFHAMTGVPPALVALAACRAAQGIETTFRATS